MLLAASVAEAREYPLAVAVPRPFVRIDESTVALAAASRDIKFDNR